MATYHSFSGVAVDTMRHDSPQIPLNPSKLVKMFVELISDEFSSNPPTGEALVNLLHARFSLTTGSPYIEFISHFATHKSSQISSESDNSEIPLILSGLIGQLLAYYDDIRPGYTYSTRGPAESLANNPYLLTIATNGLARRIKTPRLRTSRKKGGANAAALDAILSGKSLDDDDDEKAPPPITATQEHVDNLQTNLENEISSLREQIQTMKQSQTAFIQTQFKNLQSFLTSSLANLSVTAVPAAGFSTPLDIPPPASDDLVPPPFGDDSLPPDIDEEPTPVKTPSKPKPRKQIDASKLTPVKSLEDASAAGSKSKIALKPTGRRAPTRGGRRGTGSSRPSTPVDIPMMPPPPVEEHNVDVFGVLDEQQEEAAAAEAAAQSSGKIKYSEHPDYAKFFKMKKLGVSRIQLEHKMKAGGFDPSCLDTPDEYVPGS